MAYRDDREALRLRLAQIEDERSELVEKIRGLVPAQRLIDRARVASPCDARWDRMKGNDTKRFCRLCRKYVYNVSQLSTAQAEHLLGSAPEVCMQLYRRADGTVLTADCPPGRRARRVRRGVAIAVFGVTTTLVASAATVTRSMGVPHVHRSTKYQSDDVIERELVREPPFPELPDDPGEGGGAASAKRR